MDAASIKKIMVAGIVLMILFSLLNSRTSYAQAPGVSAESAILMEQDSGRVLFGKNEHEKMRIASITKIMTAILAIESGKMDEVVKVSERAVYTEGSSIYLKVGERVRLEDLVYGLMLRSGNDAATAIAEHVGGSVEGFVFLMNQKAQEIGMRDTYFSNPHGLDDHEKHFSTAYDMALLTKYAMDNATYRKISSTKIHRAPQEGKKYDRVWKNKNKLLRMYEYSTGGKTGYTRRAKRTLVSTAEKDGMGLIVVTLNDGDDWNDHINLFEWGFKTFDLVPIVDKGTIEGLENETYKDSVEAPRSFLYPLTDQEKSEVKNEITLYTPPENGEWKGEPPSPIGKLTIHIKEKTVGTVPLYLEGTYRDVHEKSFWQTLSEVITKFFMVPVNHG